MSNSYRKIAKISTTGACTQRDKQIQNKRYRRAVAVSISNNEFCLPLLKEVYNRYNLPSDGLVAFDPSEYPQPLSHTVVPLLLDHRVR